MFTLSVFLNILYLCDLSFCFDHTERQSKIRMNFLIFVFFAFVFVYSLYLYLCIPIFLELALSWLTRQTVGQKGLPIGAERITQLFHHIHRVLTDVAMFPLFHFTAHCLTVKEMRMTMTTLI